MGLYLGLLMGPLMGLCEAFAVLSLSPWQEVSSPTTPCSRPCLVFSGLMMPFLCTLSNVASRRSICFSVLYVSNLAASSGSGNFWSISLFCPMPWARYGDLPFLHLCILQSYYCLCWAILWPHHHGLNLMSCERLCVFDWFDQKLKVIVCIRLCAFDTSEIWNCILKLHFEIAFETYTGKW